MFKVPVTLFFIALIVYFFWVDRKNNRDVSPAIWIPFIALLFASTRPIYFWLEYWFDIATSADFESGNAIERVFDSIILLSAFIVLKRRKFPWGEWIKNNSSIIFYFSFGLLSILWSDYPFVLIKRFIKTAGTILLVLVILTEAKPYVAFGTILRRLAFICIPLSILFIWYYPSLGMGYHSWAGTKFFQGVAMSKNALGNICLFTGVYLTWNILFNRVSDGRLGQKLHFSMYLFLCPMTAWLLYKSHSSTSLVCLLAAMGILFLARQQLIIRAPTKLIIICFTGILFYAILELLFNISDTIIIMLGKSPDLTERVPMWRNLIAMVNNPLIGFGFESFWLGDRRLAAQEVVGEVIQAHSGYVETYLNLGLTGVILLAIWILTGLKKIIHHITIDYYPTALKFCLLVIVCLYNFTEASFYGKNMMWTFFLLSTIDYRNKK